MKFKMLIIKSKEHDPELFNTLREREISARIRRRYTQDQELAILRQRDAKPDEFKAYNEYADQCKAEVNSELEESE